LPFLFVDLLASVCDICKCSDQSIDYCGLISFWV
jgi:hypothetical protein